MSWTTIRADEYCESVRDGTHDTPKQTETGYKLVTGKHIKNGQIDPSDAYCISEKDYKKINERSLVEQWDVLMSMIGTVGEVAVVKDHPNYAIKNVALFKCAGSELKGKWLAYYLQSSDAQGHMSGNQKGSSQQFLSLKQLRSLPVPVADEAYMQKAVDVLSTYDDLIENNQKQIKLLEEAAQRLYKEWFVDLRFPGHETTPITDGIPEGWKRERLVDIVKVQYGYAFDGSLFNANGNGTPIVRIRNIPAGTTADYTTEDADPQYIVHNGDILVGMDGEFHINSWSGPDAYLVQRTCSFRPYNPNMKGYLLQAIYEPIKYFESTVVGATVAHLGKKHIDTITVLTGPDKLYVPFQQYFERRQLLLNQNRLLAEGRDRLLPKLMNGEIEV